MSSNTSQARAVYKWIVKVHGIVRDDRICDIFTLNMISDLLNMIGDLLNMINDLLNMIRDILNMSYDLLNMICDFCL